MCLYQHMNRTKCCRMRIEKLWKTRRVERATCLLCSSFSYACSCFLCYCVFIHCKFRARPHKNVCHTYICRLHLAESISGNFALCRSVLLGFGFAKLRLRTPPTRSQRNTDTRLTCNNNNNLKHTPEPRSGAWRAQNACAQAKCNFIRLPRQTLRAPKSTDSCGQPDPL